MGKETTPHKSSPSAFFKVKQRTKEGPITIEGYIGIEEGCIIKGKQGFKKIVGEPEEENYGKQEGVEEKKKIVDGFKLKITVDSNDWGKLWSYCLNYQKHFAEHLWSDLICPALKELETKKGARGRYKESKHLVNWLKSDASFLYAYFTYWDKKPVGEWPDFLQKLLNKIREDEAYSFYVFGKGTKGIFKAMEGKTRPYKLTRYCIEKVHGKLLKKYGLKPFDDPKNFLETYIYENGRAARVKKFFIKGKTIQEVTQLAYKPSPLRFILEGLQVI